MCSSHLFPDPPRVEFRPERERCGSCDSALKVLKTRTRKIVTLHLGAFSACETVSICPACKRTHGSEQLQRLVPSSCNFGYDIVVYVGAALFRRHRNGQEVIDELAAKNIAISQSEIHLLGRRFITCLALAHRQCAGRIKHAMSLKGGYILHLDGTCEGRDPILMTGLDSIMEIVLGNVKLPSENAGDIVPFLKDIEDTFGTPIALVHDMGKGIINAVQSVFPHAKDFICHYHFLRDLGKDFLGDEYETIQKRLRKHRIGSKLRYRAGQLKKRIDEHPELADALERAIEHNTLPDCPREHIPLVSAYSLIQWALDYKSEGHGYGFPFDRPHAVFAHRAHAVAQHLDELKDIELRHDWRDNKPYYRTLNDLRDLLNDKVLNQTLAAFNDKAALFDRLRDAMGIAPIDGGQGLNDDGTEKSIKTIEQRVSKFYDEFRAHPSCADKAYQAMGAQLKHYWAKLFADPIEVDTPQGKVWIQPQRTNDYASCCTSLAA